MGLPIVIEPDKSRIASAGVVQAGRRNLDVVSLTLRAVPMLDQHSWLEAREFKSRSRSRLWKNRRKRKRSMFPAMVSSRGVEHAGYSLDQLSPFVLLSNQLFFACLGQGVILGSLVVFRRFPLRIEPAFLFEPMQGGIERSGFN
jgi:hypothetical protein